MTSEPPRAAVPPIWLPATLIARGRGKPGETYWDIAERRLWRWDGQQWVADGDGGRAGEVIMTGGRREWEARERALEEAKTIEGVVGAVPDEDDKG